MGVTRVQVRIPRATGFPEDVVVNTFHFKHAIERASAQGATGMEDAIQRFYAADNAAGNAISEYLANSLNLAQTEMRFYHLADAEPRIPFKTVVRSIDAVRKQNGDLPAEVAVVLSVAADAVSGEKKSRRRGRIFLGPLNDGARGVVVTGDVRPNDNFLVAIIDAAKRLKDETSDSVALDMDWAVYSAGKGTFHPTKNPDGTADWEPFSNMITNGWVDNAFDTQRRRGSAPTIRNAFVA